MTPAVNAARSVPSMLRALPRVLSPSGFPYGSHWDLFRDAHFGRDAAETAEDLVRFRPDIARAVIHRLAELQGTVFEPRTEEEPGKIHHEYRARIIDGHPIGEHSTRILEALAVQWHFAGNAEEARSVSELTYYGTVDATPLYVRLAGTYCALYGPAILDHPYTPRRWGGGASLPTIRDSIRHAVGWIARRIEASDLGLLEFHRLSPAGHRFQAWKDGYSSYMSPNGRLANFDAPIASIEVQGLAYDALGAAPMLLAGSPAAERDRWVRLQERVQRNTMERFWMPAEQYFALAIQRNRRTGEAEPVTLLASNAGALLDSGIFDTLPAAERSRYVSSVVERIYSDEFLTPAGIRCSSLVHAGIPGYPSYQSSFTVWHKETYDIAKGMRRQGFPCLASDLENRLLNAVNVAGGAREFLYVMPDNRVDYRALAQSFDGAEEIAGTNVPENDQAWSISAALAIKRDRGNRPPTSHAAAPSSDLERRKLREHPPVHTYRTVAEVAAARAAGARFWINTKRGAELERSYSSTHG